MWHCLCWVYIASQAIFISQSWTSHLTRKVLIKSIFKASAKSRDIISHFGFIKSLYSLRLFKITSEEPNLAGKLGLSLTGATGSHHTQYFLISRFAWITLQPVWSLTPPEPSMQSLVLLFNHGTIQLIRLHARQTTTAIQSPLKNGNLLGTIKSRSRGRGDMIGYNTRIDESLSKYLLQEKDPYLAVAPIHNIERTPSSLEEQGPS